MKYLLSLLLLLILTSTALAGTVTIAWDHTNDGTVNRFKININKDCTTITSTVVVPAAQTSGTFTQQYTTTTLASNTVYCFTILGMTEANIESRTTSILRIQTH